LLADGQQPTDRIRFVVVERHIAQRANGFEHTLFLALAAAGDSLLDCRDRNAQAGDAELLEAQHDRAAIAIPQGRLAPLGPAGNGLKDDKIEVPAVGHELMKKQIERMKALAVAEARTLVFRVELEDAGQLVAGRAPHCPASPPTKIQR
jgi:hypothetical protein